MGNAERCWASVKGLKEGQRSHLSAKAVTMQATCYGAASAERVALERRFKGSDEIITWEDADLDRLGLGRYGIDVEALESSTNPVRVYNCWTEPWELDILRVNDLESQAKFLRKYGGIEFSDGDDSYVIHSGRLSFRKRRGDNRYCVIACRELYESEDDDDTPSQAAEKAKHYDLFEIDDDLHGVIYEHYKAHPDPGIRCIPPPNDAGAVDGDGQWNNWIPEEPKAVRKAKKAGRRKKS